MNKSLFLAALAVLLSNAAPLAASAHDSRVKVAGATSVTFGFTDGVPMAFAPVKIYGPSDAIPFLESTTDGAGRVFFQPSRDGLWRAEATDKDGHQASLTVSIAGGVPVGNGKGVPDGVVAISLVLNLVMVSLLAARRRGNSAARTRQDGID